MKINIYQKLHKAACEAGGVAKGKKVQGMHFNPLLHDEVQKVAMEALLNNGLYPETYVCSDSSPRNALGLSVIYYFLDRLHKGEQNPVME